MVLTLRIFICFLILFGIHRSLADSDLRSIFIGDDSDLTRQLIVGLCSDIWISALLTLPIYVLSLITRRRFILVGISVLWLLIWGHLTAMHQGYVEFFKTQIIPFHLHYLIDVEFAKANAGTFFTFGPLTIFATASLMSLWLALRAAKTRESRGRNSLVFLAITIAALIGHMANIRYRIQWFVPESLQMNYIEFLVTGLTKKLKPLPLSASESKLLAKLVRNDLTTTGAPPLKTLLTVPNELRNPIIALYQAKVSKLLSQNRPPLLIVLAAESFRPADTGSSSRPEDGPSLTPQYDQLAQNGTLFERAYSSGPVTRGGQEAMWCGLPTGTNTSLMRSFPALKWSCVPDLAQEYGVRSYWIHGGDARFDSQASFWRRHHVTDMLLKHDFPRRTPETSWGVSDKALLSKAFDFLQNALLADNTANQPILAFILSVTNHIPWDLPDDASEQVRRLNVSHPSYRTTAYFDEALGEFVGSLKEKELWGQTLLIIASDHGNLEKPYHEDYRHGDDFKYEELMSHINLLVAGGIAEDLVRTDNVPKRIKEVTSQIQISSFLRLLINNKDDRLFETPLFAKALWPVTADLNQYIYLPEISKKLSKEDALTRTLTNAGDRPLTPEELASLRYRAMIQMLYEN